MQLLMLMMIIIVDLALAKPIPGCRHADLVDSG
jgi:hypothetical protein